LRDSGRGVDWELEVVASIGNLIKRLYLTQNLICSLQVNRPILIMHQWHIDVSRPTTRDERGDGAVCPGILNSVERWKSEVFLSLSNEVVRGLDIRPTLPPSRQLRFDSATELRFLKSEMTSELALGLIDSVASL
jgi:hypothetical protein